MHIRKVIGSTTNARLAAFLQLAKDDFVITGYLRP